MAMLRCENIYYKFINDQSWREANLNQIMLIIKFYTNILRVSGQYSKDLEVEATQAKLHQ